MASLLITFRTYFISYERISRREVISPSLAFRAKPAVSGYSNYSS